MASILEQYRIADLLEWHREKRLELNPHFQRGRVWTPAARTYLIDTILRQLPIPKVFLRTRIDIGTKRSIREVVDGQQRLRAIIDFSNDKFALSSRAAEFSGMEFSDLEPEFQERFLGYPIAVDQLLNATDQEVLEVFSRLNSYSVPLNPAERRHATFQGDLKWSIHASSQKWRVLWEDYDVVTTRQRVRLQDDSLMAEMYSVLMEGVRDGGQPKITAFYKRWDPQFVTEAADIPWQLDAVLGALVPEILDQLRDTPLLRSPHFLMLFAGASHSLIGIPQGDLKNLPAPEIQGGLGRHAVDRLLELASAIEDDEPPAHLEPFAKASRSSTQRIASRRVRFPHFLEALQA